MEQSQRRTSDLDVGKRDSAQREKQLRAAPGRAHAGDRPKAAQEGGLLRELKDTPRSLD